MKQQFTKCIILSRTNYGEADRILTLLSLDYGKLRLMAKGVRRVKSKLAGGIELFSVSDITFSSGRGGLGTLMSARLDHHYGNIVNNIDRVQLGYEIINRIHKVTEDATDEYYFLLLEQVFISLNDFTVSDLLIKLWFNAQLIKILGRSPNMTTDVDNKQLLIDKKYNFDFDNMAFLVNDNGRYSAQQIKVLRLLFSSHQLKTINKISNLDQLLPSLSSLIDTMMHSSIGV